jgi:flagellar biosynthesis protein FlhF
MTKTYIAKSVDEAIARARQELGAEATLLNTRRVEGGYEIVFGVPEPPEVGRTPWSARDALVPPELEPTRGSAADQGVRPTASLAQGLERLHLQMDEIRALLVRPDKPSAELADVYQRLIASEVDPALSRDIVDRLEESAAFRRRAGLEAIVLSELERRVGVAGLNQDAKAIVLVGPPGGGKTTTAAKLAALVSGLVVSLDGSTAVPSLTEFVVIDTPGFAPSDWEIAEETAAALAECTGVETHLVVPGYMKAADLRRCIQRFAMFRPTKLLVTKMDETHSFGSVFSEAAHAGLALSFLTHGPRIPDDIRPASREDLLALALEQHPARVLNAA